MSILKKGDMMEHTLMSLPFKENALEPYISAETISYHYGKHHQGYVNKVNALIKGTPFENSTIEEIIEGAEGALFNNASQVYNHDFYFRSLSGDKSEPSQLLQEWIDREFGSMEDFKTRFSDTAASLFGSGWTWLCVNNENRLTIVPYSNAQSPLRDGLYPLLVCDVWEHAYYIDYRNARASYLEKWWNIVNWDFVSERLGAYKYVEFPCDEHSGACG